MSDSPGLLEALLAESHLVVPDQLPALIAHHAKQLGASTAVLYRVDIDQHWLIPLPADDRAVAADLPIDGTLAGRCYRVLDIVDRVHQGEGRTVWVPVVDGTERLGVLQLHFPLGHDDDPEQVRAFAGLIAELVMTKSAYGDFFELRRRRKPITVTAELAWQMMPPLTFGTDDVVIAAALVPSDDLGGDAFDYGVDRRQAQVAVFDGMGHGLGAGLLSTAAVAAYRNARRSRFDLQSTADHVGRTIKSHFTSAKFVTGIVASLDRATGVFTWCVAGHPQPLLLRGGRAVRNLDRGTGQPFGIGPASDVFSERLEPGDRVLLYTDGVTEGRTAGGDLFGLDRLTSLVSVTSSDDPPPETMRRLMHAIENHNDGPMHDDATVVMIEWRGRGSQQLLV